MPCASSLVLRQALELIFEFAFSVGKTGFYVKYLLVCNHKMAESFSTLRLENYVIRFVQDIFIKINYYK